MSSARAAPPTFNFAPIHFDVGDLPYGNRMSPFLGDASLEKECDIKNLFVKFYFREYINNLDDLLMSFGLSFLCVIGFTVLNSRSIHVIAQTYDIVIENTVFRCDQKKIDKLSGWPHSPFGLI